MAVEAQQIRDTLENSGFTEQQAVGLTTVLSHLATKQDVAELRTEMHDLEGRLTAQMHALEGRLLERIHGIERQLHDMEGRLRSEFHQEMGRLRGEMWWRMTLLLLAQAGLIVSLIKLL